MIDARDHNEHSKAASAQSGTDQADTVQAETVRADADQGPQRLQVADLMQGRREAILEHAGQDYRLRITSNNKLILTK